MQIKSWIILLSVLVLTTAVHAVDYIQPQPFAKQKQLQSLQKAPVQSNYYYPTITWGAAVLPLDNQALFPGGVKLMDDPIQQIQAVCKGETPFFRQTVGSSILAQEAFAKCGINMEVFTSLTDSTGGDVVVVRNTIKTLKDWCGRTAAIQYGGPHMGYFVDLKELANCPANQPIQLKYVSELTGPNSPEDAIRNDANIDIAFVIFPDALNLTEGNSAVDGLVIGTSTKVQRESIKDIVLVRSDWANANKSKLSSIRNAFFVTAQGKLQNKPLITKTANLLFGKGSQGVQDLTDMIADTKFHNQQQSDYFLTSPTNFNSLQKKVNRISKDFVELGFLSSRVSLTATDWNVKTETTAQIKTVSAQTAAKIAKEVKRADQSGHGSVLISTPVYFKANQNNFDIKQYASEFQEGIKYAKLNPGAVVKIVGNVDVSIVRAWRVAVQSKKSGDQQTLKKVQNWLNKVTNPAKPWNLPNMSSQLIQMELNMIEKAAMKTSQSRADAVAEALVEYAKKEGVDLNVAQMVIVPSGADNPEVAKPRSKSDVERNMRVEFTVTVYKAEADLSTFYDEQDF